MHFYPLSPAGYTGSVPTAQDCYCLSVMRRIRWWLVVVGILMSTDATAQIRVDALAPRPPFRISIFTVRGGGVTIPLVAFQEWARQAVEEHMHAEIVPMDEMLARGGAALTQRMTACQGDPRCFKQVIGRAVDARYLLVLTASVLGDTRLLGARLLDLKKLRIVGEAIDELEPNQSFLDAIQPRVRASVPKRRWDPFGELRIVAESGAQISVNGRIVGMSPIAPMPYLLPGKYEVVAEKRGYTTGRATTEVKRGASVEAKLDLVALAPPEEAPTWYWWAGGAGAAVVTGVVVTAVLLSSGGGEPTFCTAPDASLCAP